MKKFSGANFCFWVGLLVLCFLVDFCLCFCFISWRFAPESVWKNSLDVRSGVFWGRSLSFFFVRRRRFSRFFLKRYSSGSNRTPPHAPFCLFLFSFCVPPHLFLPVLAVRPASCVFFGVPFWAPCVFGILLVLALRPLFLGTRGGRGVRVLLVLGFFFSPSALFCGYTFLDARVGSLTEVG